jgi:glycosyltransferase involved in cell wall biosynthesis
MSAAARDGRPVALLFATSGHSGVDRVVGNLLPELAALGVPIDLLGIRRHGPDPDPLPEGVRRVRLPVAHKASAVVPLAGYLLRHRPRALLTANHPLNRAALLARRLTRVDTRVTIRLGMSLSETADGGAKPRSAIRSMRRWYPLADAVVTPSQGVASDLVRLAGVDPGKVRVIPNPIVNARLHAQAAAPVEHPWLAERNRPVVLGVGELSPRKDFETLVRAFAVVRRERPCRLVVLGEGRSRPAIEALAERLGIREDIWMPGFEPNPYRYMARASLFVSSSRREGSSAVIVEALALGLPVVATDCPSGPAETLQGGRYGPLVPVGDSAAMADAMRATLDAPLPAAVLREAAAPFEARRAALAYLKAMGVPPPAGEAG